MTGLHYVTDEEAAEEHRRFFAEMKAVGTPVCEQGCFVQLPPDGVCRLCEKGTTPPDVLAARAIFNGWGENWGLFDSKRYTYDEVKAARLIVEAYERIERQVIRDEKTAPNGCRYCGHLDGVGHGRRWSAGHVGAGTDVYVSPTDAQRLGRMLARRAAADMRVWREVNRRWVLRTTD